MNQEACEALRDLIVARKITNWRGFSATCSPAILLPSPVSHEQIELYARWQLGEEHIESRFVPVSLTGYDRARVSFQADDPVLFNANYPELADPLTDVLLGLGQPAAKLTAFVNLLEVPDGEWVFPERGITLFLNTTYESVLHIALYAPVSLDDYREKLRPDLRVRKRPLKMQ